jgi:hypothetical protein
MRPAARRLTASRAAALAVAVAAAPLALPAQTLDLPPRKAGLWELSTRIEKPQATPPLVAQMCLDSATDRDLMSYALKLTDGTCKKLTSKREGKALVIEAECAVAKKVSKTRTEITGDLQSAYTMRTEGSLEGGSKGPQTMLTTQTATWKGENCLDMKPGDISLFGGVKMNINQLKALSGLIR